MGTGSGKIPDGDEYEGEMKGNRMHGHGVYRWGNGNVYDGEFIKGKLQGQGRIEFSLAFGKENGGLKAYEGEFNNGMPDGVGKIEFLDGRVYVGTVSEGAPNGEG